MLRGERVCETYRPEADFVERWPEWSVFDTSDLPPGERFSPTLRTVLMNSDGDREWAMAHVVAHLDLAHHLMMDEGTFSEAQEADAEGLAGIRLGLYDWSEAAESDEDEWDDVPMDGEPTVYR
jgi:hypothetical protein